MRKHVLAAAAAAMVVTAGFAVQAQEMPKPAAEMAKIAFFNGNWTCEGKMHESPMSPAGAMTGTAAIKSDLGGFFQSGAIKSSMGGMTVDGMFHATYDAGAKQFVMFWFDSMGGWARSSSAGWSGDTMVYEGESHMGPMTMKSRDTFTKMGAAGMKHVMEAEMGGKWMTTGEETCRK